VPAVNQIELHPYLQQTPLRELHAGLGIVTQAWSPLARGALLRDPLVTALAGRHGLEPAQVVLRWHLQLGNVVFPKSASKARIRSNIDIFDFALTDEEMAAITALDRDGRTGWHPDEFNG
jgi:2,5-diketo-D-gluconate reductase A